jgi:L,D-transpeptidase catalytic domain
MINRYFKITLYLIAVFIFCACKNKKKILASNFNYKVFKDSIIKQAETAYDTSNFFDDKSFIPEIDSLDALIIGIDTLLQEDAKFLLQEDSLKSALYHKEIFSKNDKERLRINIISLDSFLVNKNIIPKTDCKGKECLVYAEINKATQTLYLYIVGELTDSFKVSTGIRKRETPNLNLSPRGPILMKYTSKKFPGGNYNHLGNMPYAVFIRGGYAIHGTTTGNFSKLGTRASHGCIRLHPDNAKVFFELVKLAGLSQTWVTIKDSLP